MASTMQAQGPLATMPAETRLIIINEILPVGPIRYTWLPDDNERLSVTPAPDTRSQLRKHGLMYVNRRINHEYTEELYKRTQFFLYVDARNLMTDYFWPLLRPELNTGVRHIRRCTIYFDTQESYRDQYADVVCSRLSQLKSYMIQSDFIKLEELRVVAKLPTRSHAFSHGPVEMTDGAIKKSWLQDLQQLPRLTSIWLTIGSEVDVKYRKTKDGWQEEAIIIPAHIRRIMHCATVS